MDPKQHLQSLIEIRDGMNILINELEKQMNVREISDDNKAKTAKNQYMKDYMRSYMRDYRRKHPEKVKAANDRYWIKKAQGS